MLIEEDPQNSLLEKDTLEKEVTLEEVPPATFIGGFISVFLLFFLVGTAACYLISLFSSLEFTESLKICTWVSGILSFIINSLAKLGRKPKKNKGKPFKQTDKKIKKTAS